MSPTKGEQTREHILKTTRKILTARGFHNTPISEIITATGVKKGNLYYHFSSKEELGLAVLMDAKQEFFAFLANSFAGQSPLGKIIHHCEMILSEQQKNNFVGGCLFGNTALEMSDSNPRFAKEINEVFTVWTGQLSGYFKEAKQAGLLSTTIPSALLATTVVATIEGGIMMARANKEGSSLDDCLTVLKALLQSP